MVKIFEWLLHILEITMGRHQWIAQPTTKTTPQNKIYYKHSSKELSFLDILIKTEIAKSSQISITNQQTPKQYLHFKSHLAKNYIKSNPYTLARRIHTIITDKKRPPPKKNALKNCPQSYTREDT